MRFTVSTSALQKQLQLVSGALGSNNSLPIVEGFLFEIEEGSLKISATDLETSMSTQIDVMSDQNGAIAVPSKILLDIIKNLPEQPITFNIDLDSFGITLLSQKGKYKLTGEDADEFPAPPEIDEPRSITISSGVLGNAVQNTLFAVSTDELRPSMTGVYFKADDEGITFVATDAYKLVRYQITDDTTDEPVNFILPRKALSLIKNALPSTETRINIAYDAGNAFFSFNDVQLACRLIESRYPNYNAVIPSNNSYTAVLNRVDFLNALKRVAIFANKTTYQVNLTITADELKLTAQDIDFSNEATETIACQYDGDETMHIAFNGRFLSEILNVLKCDEIYLKLSTPSRSGIIVPTDEAEDEHLLMLITPIMINR